MSLYTYIYIYIHIHICIYPHILPDPKRLTRIAVNLQRTFSAIRRTGFSRTGFMDARVCIINVHSLYRGGVLNVCVFIELS